MTSTVIIPTTGSSDLKFAIESVLSQTHPTLCYVICDGEEYFDKVKSITDDYVGNGAFKLCCLQINVGRGEFYGHRIYAAFTHLINSEFLSYLDQDNWLDSDHVKSCINTIRNSNLDWCYALRKVFSKERHYLCNDDCESLGKWQTFQGGNLVDTNAYFISTKVAIKGASLWHGGWGQDRVFLKWISFNFTKFECTGKYTLNYCLGGNPNSVTQSFFEHGNKIMFKKYNGNFPWSESI